MSQMLSAVLGIVLLGGVGLGLVSCSTTPPAYAPADITREQAWQSINWRGEGRGILIYRDQPEKFRMETDIDRLAKTWTLVVRLPLLGEEHLAINYKTGKIDGPLWQRWKKQNPQADITPLKRALLQVLRQQKIPSGAVWDQYTLAFAGPAGVYWQFGHWKNGRFHWAQVTLTEIYEYPLKLELEWREESGVGK